MKLLLAGQLKYIHGKKGSSVYYHFTDQFGARQRISLKVTVDSPGNNKQGEAIFPSEAYTIAKSIDNEVREYRWNMAAPKTHDKIHLQAAFDQFLDMRRPNIAPATISLHELSFKKLIEYFGDIPVEQITQEKMVAFRKHIIDLDRIENASWWLRHLSAFFNYCADPDVNIIQRTPLTKRVKIKSPDKPIVIFNPDELDSLYEYITAEHGQDATNHLRFLELTGWRVGDSTVLKRKQIDYSRRVIQQLIQKGSKYRDYPMDSTLLGFMRMLPVFGEYAFKYRSINSLGHIFHDAIDKVVNHKLGMVSVHTLRKQFTYHCYQNGMPVEDCSRLLGHRSISTTLKYYHYFDTDNLRDSLEKSRNHLAKKSQKKIIRKLSNSHK